MKRFFCKVFGHTWVPASSNPKTSWNVDKTGQLLVPTRSGEMRFYHECVRCRERRELSPPRRG